MALGAATGLAAQKAVQPPTFTQHYLPENVDELHTRFRFQCEPAVNGWILTFRDRFYIAKDIDDLMDQIRTAMVTEKLK